METFQEVWARLQAQWAVLQGQLAQLQAMSVGTSSDRLPACQERLGALPAMWEAMSPEKCSEEAQALSAEMELERQALQELLDRSLAQSEV